MAPASEGRAAGCCSGLRYESAGGGGAAASAPPQQQSDTRVAPVIAPTIVAPAAESLLAPRKPAAAMGRLGGGLLQSKLRGAIATTVEQVRADKVSDTEAKWLAAVGQTREEAQAAAASMLASRFR